MQQPLRASRRPVPAPAAQTPSSARSSVGVQPAPAPKTAFDSAIAAVSDIGIKVAEVRSAYSAYRLAAFNQADGAVVERAVQFGVSSRTLATAIQNQSRNLCRSCMANRNTQTILDAYRTSLTSVQRTAQQFATRMQNVNPGTPAPARTARLRSDVRAVGVQLVQGLQEYEARLHALRGAMGWDVPPMPTPRRGNGT